MAFPDADISKKRIGVVFSWKYAGSRHTFLETKRFHFHFFFLCYLKPAVLVAFSRDGRGKLVRKMSEIFKHSVYWLWLTSIQLSLSHQEGMEMCKWVLLPSITGVHWHLKRTLMHKSTPSMITTNLCIWMHVLYCAIVLSQESSNLSSQRVSIPLCICNTHYIGWRHCFFGFFGNQ